MLHQAGSRRLVLPAQQFREIMLGRDLSLDRLPSTWFDVVPVQAGSVFRNGRGFGHGVGMCQYGAGGQTKKGRSYPDILSRYYTDIELRTLDYDGAAPD